MASVSGGCDGDGGPSPTASASPRIGTPVMLTTTLATPPASAAAPTEGGYVATRVLPEVGFAQMTGLYIIPGDEDFAVLLTKDGLLRRISMRDDGPAPSTYLDLREKLIRDPATEEGLLGLAFAPDFPTSRRFFVYYTAGDPRRSVVSRFLADGDTADASSERVVIEIAEPFANHNGGGMEFGADGYLYIGVGDGGSAGDPMGNGQNTGTLLGSMLRIDVSGDGYVAPQDNPFTDGGGAPEIWAYGLRNPWRFSFDTATGQLWAADVGQNRLEEIDRIDRGGNYGWNIMEGDECFRPRDGCIREGLIMPRAVYTHDDGCSVTGGYVYRGRALPELRGYFVYGDFCSGIVWAVHTADDSAPVALMESGHSISSFGRDKDGELYLVTFDNAIFRIDRK